MKNIKHLIFSIALLLPAMLHAQIDTVIVEKYYVSDANDSVGTNLPEGSVTYRVFIQLKEGTKIKSLFGDQDHPFKIWSSQPFYNHATGKSFGKDVDPEMLKQNTVALDSWLTLGLATTGNTGVLKSDDTDGSIVGGSNNDQGMLAATNPNAGEPLTQKDGLVAKDNLQRFWYITLNNTPYPAENDTTIFGTTPGAVQDTAFISNNFKLWEPFGNAAGIDNKILVAQLTTKGKLHFEINAELTTPDGKTTKYVSGNADILEGEVLDSNLVYHSNPPRIPVCGCPDYNYLEYNPNRECDSVELCKTKIVLGCMDEKSCNYNPEANVSDGLCCYPGNCANRDIRFVCPEIGKGKLEFKIFPNPVQENLKIEITTESENPTKCLIVDPYGRVVKEVDLGVVLLSETKEIFVSDLSQGLYMVKVFRDAEKGSKVFIKE